MLEQWDPEADIEATNNDGFTSLLIAASFGHLEVVSLLLAHSANVHAQNNRQVTSLIIACRNHAEVVSYCCHMVRILKQRITSRTDLLP